MDILWDIDQLVGDTAVHRDKMKSGHLAVSLAALSAPSHIPERNSPNLSVTMNKLAETLKTVSKDKFHWVCVFAEIKNAVLILTTFTLSNHLFSSHLVSHMPSACSGSPCCCLWEVPCVDTLRQGLW